MPTGRETLFTYESSASEPSHLGEPVSKRTTCPYCSSSVARLSRIRVRNLLALCVGRFPVRCRDCLLQRYVGFREALVLLHIRSRARYRNDLDAWKKEGQIADD
jgi:hypothetical protein